MNKRIKRQCAGLFATVLTICCIGFGSLKVYAATYAYLMGLSSEYDGVSRTWWIDEACQYMSNRSIAVPVKSLSKTNVLQAMQNGTFMAIHTHGAPTDHGFVDILEKPDILFKMR